MEKKQNLTNSDLINSGKPIRYTKSYLETIYKKKIEEKKDMNNNFDDFIIVFEDEGEPIAFSPEEYQKYLYEKVKVEDKDTSSIISDSLINEFYDILEENKHKQFIYRHELENLYDRINLYCKLNAPHIFKREYGILSIDEEKYLRYKGKFIPANGDYEY